MKIIFWLLIGILVPIIVVLVANHTWHEDNDPEHVPPPKWRNKEDEL